MAQNKQCRIFTLRQFYHITDQAVYSLLYCRKELKLIDTNFRSCIMLAVSKVNGCALCSYVHTKAALNSGSSQQDLAAMLGGNLSVCRNGEEAALLFAQHYADSCGMYDNEAFEKISSTYGEKKANGILAVIRIIMMGNVHGISAQLLLDRLKGKKQHGSPFLAEIGILLGMFVMVPTLLIKNLIIKK